ncbi:hypothetical protein KC973_01500 [Candidatus Saccharibacteria bacterium]|nr:hypothetical protein [Candidatus Saccharibacteria bacterium]
MSEVSRLQAGDGGSISSVYTADRPLSEIDFETATAARDILRAIGASAFAKSIGLGHRKLSPTDEITVSMVARHHDSYGALVADPDVVVGPCFLELDDSEQWVQTGVGFWRLPHGE